MRRLILVGISTFLRFAGQFLFIKSISHLGESLILQTLNLQSLAVLIAGFSSGGIQTYLSKHIPIDKLQTAWAICSKNTAKYLLPSILVVVPAYFFINRIETQLAATVFIIILAPLIAYSNNWQGLLTGLKRYPSLISVFFIQTFLFLILFLLKDYISSSFFTVSYPTVIVISFILSYFTLSKKIFPSTTNAIIETDTIQKEVSSYRVMGIVLMTVGVAYPFLIRNILTQTYLIETVVNWDYLMRISTAYVSVSTFFIFTLFSSDLSHDNTKRYPFFICSFLLITSYLSVFYFFNQSIIEILLSRKILLTSSELSSFIGFEIIRSFFTLVCLYNIIRGKTNKYIALELTNLIVSALAVFLIKPLLLEDSFIILAGCFGFSFIAVYFINFIKIKKQT